MNGAHVKGKRVARTPLSTVHIGELQPDGSAACLCGNVIVRPLSDGIEGPLCPKCERIVIAKESAE